MEIILAMCAGVIVGILYSMFSLRWAVQRAIQEQEDRAAVKPNMISASLEKHNDIYYLFGYESNVFIAQGRDLKEINQHLNLRFGKDIQVKVLVGEQTLFTEFKSLCNTMP